jgi:hypothetical protein
MSLLKELLTVNEAGYQKNPHEFGLTNKDNIIKAFEALLKSNLNCELDNPGNWRSMKMFYFTFKSDSDLNKAVKLITTGTNKIDTSVEDEWMDETK